VSLASLAHSIFRQQGTGEDPITFVEDDILESKFGAEFFDLIYDKGTFDSIGTIRQLFLLIAPSISEQELVGRARGRRKETHRDICERNFSNTQTRQIFCHHFLQS
jgi:hypothetical protein